MATQKKTQKPKTIKCEKCGASLNDVDRSNANWTVVACECPKCGHRQSPEVMREFLLGKVEVKSKKKTEKKARSTPKKSSVKLPDLNPKQAKYVQGVMEGKTKTQAALDAGYSESTARAATAQIEGVDVREAFRVLMRQYAPLEKVAQRIGEGLDAMETKTASFEGQITDTQDFVAWEERRRYAEMAAKMAGYFVEKQELDVNVNDLDKMTDEQLMEIAEGRGMLTSFTGVGNA